MARAFRSGIDAKRKLNMPLKARRWPTVEPVLRTLKRRAERTRDAMAPLEEIPALIRIEHDRWVFERIEASVLDAASHRLVLTEPGGDRVLGVTLTLDTALNVAQKMAEIDDRVVLIQPM